MQFLADYLKRYGEVPFTEKPFTDVDNVAMCYMYYMPFEQVVSGSFDDEPVRFSRAASQLFAQRGYEHKPVGLVLLKDISKKMMFMARSRRYAEMKMVACVDVFQKSPAVQFNAATFLLPDGDIVVLFRGTDDSLIGWEEDFDILFKDSVPSNKLATDYLDNVAAKFDGDIIVCGHSKGGYVAQYGALFCSPETRKRIKLVYNNDGPGFKDYSYIDTDNYKELLPKYRHFVPQSSLIGMTLSHDDDYQVIKSKRVLGPMQHDMSSWQIEDDKLKSVSGLSTLGKVNDMFMYNLVANLSDEQKTAFDSVLTVALGNGERRGLLDVAGDIRQSVQNGRNAKQAIDSDVMKTFATTLDNVRDSAVDANREVVRGEFKTVQERMEEQD